MLSELTREQQLIILGLVLVIVAGLGVMAYRRLSPDNSEIVIEQPRSTLMSSHSSSPRLVVHIVGAVKREGVYKIAHGDRLIDVLNLAGGATAQANLSKINLAEKVKDGQKITVPAKQTAAINASGSSSGKVSLNSASKSELCKVSGIGPGTAKKIIDFRSKNGPFSRIEDIMKVKSIGKSKFGKIKGHITI